MIELQQPSLHTLSLQKFLKALSHPMRLRMVHHLAQSPGASCKQIGLPIAKSTVSVHLQVLREAGLVHVVKDGKEYIITLRRAEVQHRFPGLLEAVLRAYEKSTIASS